MQYSVPAPGGHKPDGGRGDPEGEAEGGRDTGQAGGYGQCCRDKGIHGQYYSDTGIQGYMVGSTAIQGYSDTVIQGYRDTGIQDAVIQ